MGWNSTVVVMHDALSDIAKDKNFGKKLADACQNAVIANRREKTFSVTAGGAVSAAIVIESHHADGAVMVLVGGNTGRQVFPEVYIPYDATDVKALKEMADSLGYRLEKKARDQTG